MSARARHLLRRSLFVVATPLVLLLGTSAEAQQTQRLSPVGGRTTLVGGTGVVFGQDSASAFLNPATTVRVDKNRLSFSVDFYNLSYLSSSSWYQPGSIDRTRFGGVETDGNQAVSAFDFDTLPGSLCIFLGTGDIPGLSNRTKKEMKERLARLGFCFASIQYNAFTFNAEDYEQQTPNGVTRQSQNLRQTFRKLAFGPTYAMYLSDRIVVGASVHATRSSHRRSVGATSTTYAGGPDAISSSFYNVARGDSHDLTATVGLTYRISKRQTVGVALQSPSLHLFGAGGINHHTNFRGGGTSPTDSTFSGDGPFVARTPARIALGTGIEGPAGSLEFNVAAHAPLDQVYTADLEGRSFDAVEGQAPSDRPFRLQASTRALGTVNFGVGGEAFTSPAFSLLGGLSADASIVPKGTLQNDPFGFYPSRSHRIAGSFGLASHGENGDLLIGLEASYGWGERVTPNMYTLPARLDVTDQETYGLLFVLAGSTNFRSFKRAVESVREAVDPNRDPTPKPDAPPPEEEKREK